jgi:hypothetical protein
MSWSVTLCHRRVTSPSNKNHHIHPGTSPPAVMEAFKVFEVQTSTGFRIFYAATPSFHISTVALRTALSQ